MSNSMYVTTCSICGKEKPCTPVTFLPVNGQDTVRVKPYTGVRSITYPGEFCLCTCEKCGKKNGQKPRGLLLTLLIGYIVMIAGIALSAVMKTGSSINGGGMFLIMAGWFASMIAMCILIFKARFEMSGGGLFFGLFFSFFPFTNLLVLLFAGKKIVRGARAMTALKLEAEKQRREEREKSEALAQRLQSDEPLTEEEQQALEEQKRKQEAAEQQAEYAKAEQAENVRKSNLSGAVIGIVITIVLGIYGASVYSSGRGYMTLFGSIELSPGGFAAVIGAFLIWDIASIVSATKKK